ncbi:MAG TPA: MCP four helix bundle domain-containing protein, partial [Candidatus Paceibacterota bacterium]|nr:MCP four helix bundle domain-containing protein [Candidatus Paceibacterota bacterium]
MKNWTIGKRITFGFAVLLAILVAVSVISYERIQAIHANMISLTEEGVPALELLGDLSSRIREDEGILYKHISATSEKDMADLEARLAENSKVNSVAYEKLEKLLTDPHEKELLEKMKTTRGATHGIKKDILAASHSAT